MTAYIVQFESNIYNFSHAYGEPKTVNAESLVVATLWAESYIAATPERDNVAIRSIKTTDELIAEHEAEIAKLTTATYLDHQPDLRQRLISYQQAAIARLQGVAA